MSDSLVGRVGSVDDVPAGSVLADDHTAGESVLRVVDAADFSETGGEVEVAGSVLTYTAADLATDVLTLAEPLAAWVESDTPARLHPAAPTRVAAVEVDGADEPLQAVVPQALLDQLPLGLREVDVAESVTVALVDGAWTVRDLHAASSVSVMHGEATGVVDPVTGARLSGTNPDGTSEWPEVRAASIILDGAPVREIIEDRWVPLGESRTPAGVVYGPYTVDMPLWEGTIDVPANHTARLSARGWTRGVAGQLFLLRASQTSTTDGTMPAVPTVGSPELPPYAPFTHTSDTWEARSWEWHTAAGPLDGRVRVLVWLQPDVAGQEISASNFVFAVDLAGTRSQDFAGQVRAQAGSQAAPPPPPSTPSLVTRTQQFALTPHSSWSGSQGRAQGTYAAFVTVGRTPTFLWRTYLSIPSAAQTFASSAEELVSARVRLTASETPQASWAPSFGTSTSADHVSSEPSRRNVNPGTRTYSPSNPAGWSTVTGNTLAALKAGDPTLVVDYPTSTSPYLRFHGPGANSSLRPMLELTVRSRT